MWKEGDGLDRKNLVAAIKQDLESYVGQKIKLKTNGGRKRIIIKEGVLEKTYAHIFTVKINEKQLEQRISYNYADVLTENVELFLCDTPEGDTKIKCRA